MFTLLLTIIYLKKLVFKVLGLNINVFILKEAGLSTYGKNIYFPTQICSVYKEGLLMLALKE